MFILHCNKGEPIIDYINSFIMTSIEYMVALQYKAKDIVFKKLLNNKIVKVVGAKLHTIFF